MARITKNMFMAAVDYGIDSFLSHLNAALDEKDPVQQDLIPTPTEEKPENLVIRDLIIYYVQAYQKKYGPKARPDVGGKAQGVLKRLLKNYSPQTIKNLMSVYLQLDDEWFKNMYHDLVTFESKLQRILHAYSTGQKESMKSNLIRATEIIINKERKNIK